MKLTRKQVIDRIPFSFGIIQRIADDLNVTRAAVSQFINKPGNEEILRLLMLERSRIYDYAEINISDAIIGNDLETTKWYMSTFPNPNLPPVKKYKTNYANKLKTSHGYSRTLSSWEYSSVRGQFHQNIEVQDAYLEGANTKCLGDKHTEMLKLNPPKPKGYSTHGKEKSTEREEKRLKGK